MSLVTRCPACGTAFLVKPGQLASSRGDVRCGQCNSIFNGLEYLTETEPDVDEGMATDADKVSPDGNLPPDVEESSFPATADSAPPEPITARPPEPEPEPERNNISASRPEFKPTPVRKPAKKMPRGLLPTLSLALLLALFGQIVYFLRSEIAVLLPQTKPYLTQACKAMHCTVELPRNARLLSIDDSDLQEDAKHKGVFILSSTLVNRADYTQAYPLLELTLTDIHDAPVLRRTLKPSEYLPRAIDEDHGLQAGGEVHVRLPFTLDNLAATGYRVYVTYP